jgi:hypothetical protein
VGKAELWTPGRTFANKAGTSFPLLPSVKKAEQEFGLFRGRVDAF